jgi:hypothetical protein
LQFGWRERLEHIAVHDERADGKAVAPERRADRGTNADAACYRWSGPIRELVVQVVEIG